ncbi:tellurite resistance/C4-dicarboxylate transporter family protein [Streptomyces sp. NPDC054884]|uniref:tellurite resistance/C4-dicarboxylate transporter family protein n=1 Tax=Streptomyces sp. ME08-AFT2 TaxID=3028683 RepID=UPI0029BA19B0|nr:tellurite resistance/C4-dicarboxylate transporter family protein [Streptomyces sp. ME08-AFT2]MDX3307779.1 tellurite resistance/C4-dicarboxylate transporter family protein [Streptomyces sp. ME08-AFT2]
MPGSSPPAAPPPASPAPRRSRLRDWWARRPPASGTAVMATGIVSVGLHLAGHDALSRVWLAMAGVAWVALAADFVVRLVRERARWRAEAGTPGALTAVAATAVLGTQISARGRQTLAEALLALAAALWPVLFVTVVRRWKRRMPGAVFLCCVAPQSLAVLGAVLAKAASAAWLAHTALVLFWLGLLLYGVALGLFDFRQTAEGAGDQWVAGGALSVSALAGAKLLMADDGALYLWNADDTAVLRGLTVALLVLDYVWYAVLLYAEVRWPRPRYDERRWATVFPMGMTAAATLSVGAAVDVPGLDGPGEALLWLAVAAWLVVAAAAVGSARADLRSRAPR